ncbi:MAG: RNA polymerase-binding protein DksA [Nitrospirae bacterium]|nr:RNA polymerase-binding protein DksA [Nitrospirota bacterium]
MTKKTTTKKTIAKSAKATKPVKKNVKTSTEAAIKAAKPQNKTAAVSSKKSVKTEKSQTLSHREKVIQKIKQDLLSQRESLLKEAEETLSNLPSELNFPDMGDQATAEADRNFMLRLRDRERMLLKKIEETIERIDNGPYGICEECENEIGIKRLEARPVTKLCIDCKTRQEEEERIAEGG